MRAVSFLFLTSFFLAYYSGRDAFAQELRSKEYWEGNWDSIDSVLKDLSELKIGQQIIQLAIEKDKEFLQFVQRGKVSITESNYTRSYSLSEGKENVSIDHKIYISENLSRADAILDLAHELTHFALRPIYDPYDTAVGLKQFIRAGIEGKGGELEAFQTECLVAWELERANENFHEHGLCSKYKKKNGFDVRQAKRDYYSIGPYFLQNEDLVKFLPLLNAEDIRFTSSYAKKPYPIALVNEYQQSRKTACENNARKEKLIAAQAQEGRLPQSVSVELSKEHSKLLKYQQQFCTAQD